MSALTGFVGDGSNVGESFESAPNSTMAVYASFCVPTGNCPLETGFDFDPPAPAPEPGARRLLVPHLDIPPVLRPSAPGYTV